MTEGTRLTTRLNGKWLFKMALFLAALIGLAVWASLDAFWLYPARGRHHADFACRAYLECLSKSGRLLTASVADPDSELKALHEAKAMESQTCDAFKHVWLLSLSRIRSLDSVTRENHAAITAAGGPLGVSSLTMFADPNTRLGTANAPKPLSAFDIPLQYVFLVAGAGGALWLALFLVRCHRVSYSYDPAEKRLFLPDGTSFVPAGIAVFDKRDWHKFFVHVTLSEGGPEMKFDLLRYLPLEEWLLEMEKLHPHYEPPPPEPAEEEEEEEEEATQPANGSPKGTNPNR
jgi:hypothetical protein